MIGKVRAHPCAGLSCEHRLLAAPCILATHLHRACPEFVGLRRFVFSDQDSVPVARSRGARVEAGAFISTHPRS